MSNHFPAVLSLELIGDDCNEFISLYGGPLGARPRRAWVARLSWQDGTLQREFLRSQRDYSRANSVGSRGIYAVYMLPAGHVYEVNRLETWTRSRRYFAHVEDGKLVEISQEEAVKCLRDASSA